MQDRYPDDRHTPQPSRAAAHAPAPTTQLDRPSQRQLVQMSLLLRPDDGPAERS